MFGSKESSRSSPPSRAVCAHEESLRVMTAISPDCIKVVAIDGRLLQMNPAGLAMIDSHSWEQVQNACTCDLIAPEHRNHWLANHQRVCAGATLVWEFDIVGLKGVR